MLMNYDGIYVAVSYVWCSFFFYVIPIDIEYAHLVAYNVHIYDFGAHMWSHVIIIIVVGFIGYTCF